MVAQGESDRGYTSRAALENRAHRAAVDDVDHAIVAVVDTRDDEVRLSLPEQFVDAQLDAIGGCAIGEIDREAFLPYDLPEAQRLKHANGVGLSASRAIGCHDNDLAQCAHLLNQRPDTFGSPTVVVSDEYSHASPAMRFTSEMTACAKATACSIVGASL